MEQAKKANCIELEAAGLKPNAQQELQTIGHRVILHLSFKIRCLVGSDQLLVLVKLKGCSWTTF